VWLCRTKRTARNGCATKKKTSDGWPVEKLRIAGTTTSVVQSKGAYKS